MSKKCKNGLRILNYNEHFLILASAATGYISVSAFASLLAIPIEITSSTIWIKFYAITVEIKKARFIIKKKKKHDNIVLLGKTRLNSM